jgi:NAD(P)-dependent dehydrogenase (short-subunit alcohol dehydrogenase family)
MCYRVPVEIQEKAKQKIGLQRWGSIQELYNTVDFMIENEYVCGSNLRIDGGV